mgnify:FL=1
MLDEYLWKKGVKNIAGVDEAGRGPLAGPLISCCVVFSPWNIPSGLNDSKLLKSSQRIECFHLICETASSLGVSIVSEKFIDCMGIQIANIYSFREAVLRASMKEWPDFVIFDWIKVPEFPIPSISPSHAELKSYSVAAASIIAKVVRDSIMENHYHHLFPEYGFAYHKGYGTIFHMEKITEYGLANCHRRSFCGRFI